ncbi:MAG: 2'-deoxycytidine 5'-triphosphate deaminase [Candidatus Sulfotelmatobacter sp.]|jgi:dCTP deaminase
MSRLENPNGEVALFPDFLLPTDRDKGILPSQSIQNLIDARHIVADRPVDSDQIQPASLDLRLGDIAHRVRASFLPGPNSTVESKVKELRMTRVDLTGSAVFEKNCVYIVPLVEQLHLPGGISGRANPKSTTGRLDIFTRLITDYGTEFDTVGPGYKGNLYAEIVPRTFTVGIRAGMRLSQLRFVEGVAEFNDPELKRLDRQETLVYLDDDPAKARLEDGLRITVNLEANQPNETIAYKARSNAPLVELDRINYYPLDEFWEPIHENAQKALILEPGAFYILASREQVRVPPDYAAEMVPFDPSDGEFRIHYAGFFDPGFGYGSSDIKGTRAVLEVRAHEVPFLMEHGQLVGRLKYMPLLSRPHKIYGTNIGSSYQHQALTLSKQFRKG